MKCAESDVFTFWCWIERQPRFLFEFVNRNHSGNNQNGSGFESSPEFLPKYVFLTFLIPSLVSYSETLTLWMGNHFEHFTYYNPHPNMSRFWEFWSWGIWNSFVKVIYWSVPVNIINTYICVCKFVNSQAAYNIFFTVFTHTHT